MILCKDCFYCELLTGSIDGRDYSKCQHPAEASKRTVSLVTGELEPFAFPYADTTRKSGKCGEDAILFESKKTWRNTFSQSDPHFGHFRATGVGV